MDKIMTVDRALARIMELDGVPEAERRVEIRRILSRLDSAGWSRGSDDSRDEGWW